MSKQSEISLCHWGLKTSSQNTPHCWNSPLEERSWPLMVSLVQHWGNCINHEPCAYDLVEYPSLKACLWFYWKTFLSIWGEMKHMKQCNFLFLVLTFMIVSAWSLQGYLRIRTLFQLAKKNQREFPVVT